MTTPSVHKPPTPTEFHDRFQAVGRWSKRAAVPLAELDLPDRLSFPTDRPVLFAGNHRSLFDFLATMVIFSDFDLSSRIMIKADYVNSGIGARLFRGLGSIATSRELAQEAEDEAVAALLSGQLVSMMPEGRLMKPEEFAVNGVGPGRPGVSRIAARAGAAIIPVGFAGTEKVWPRGSVPRPRFRRPTVRLRLGDPIEITGDDHQANADAVMAELGRLVTRIS